MSDISILTPNTNVQIVRPYVSEDERSFRRRMEAMVTALQVCGHDTTAVVLIQPSGSPVCVVTQVATSDKQADQHAR